jgi:hypothetical protein
VGTTGRDTTANTSPASTISERPITTRGSRRRPCRQRGTAPHSGHDGAREDTRRRHTEQGSEGERRISAIRFFTTHRAFLAGGSAPPPLEPLFEGYRRAGSVPQQASVGYASP